MSDSFTINIDGKEYQAIGNKDKIQKSANFLNEVISEFSSNNENLKLTALERTVYTALNIVDMKMTNELNYNNSLNEIISGIRDMTIYINNFITD